jgi:formiminoglutamase
LNYFNSKNYSTNCNATWEGRIDLKDIPERFFQFITPRPLYENINPHHHYGILGFCCDEGVKRNLGRVGAKQGPSYIRKNLRNLALHKFKNNILYDYGDIICNNGDLEASQKLLSEATKIILAATGTPIILGGGHETSWGVFQGLASANKSSNIGIINFDSHFDLRDTDENERGSSGTPFLQIARLLQSKNKSFNYMCLGIQKQTNTAHLYTKARELNVTYIESQKLNKFEETHSQQSIEKFTSKCDSIYISICMDVFAQQLAPGVSAPQALGIDPGVFVNLLEYILKTNTIIAIDIVETAPILDVNEQTSKLAAYIVHNIITTLSAKL